MLTPSPVLEVPISLFGGAYHRGGSENSAHTQSLNHTLSEHMIKIYCSQFYTKLYSIFNAVTKNKLIQISAPVKNRVYTKRYTVL